MQASVADQYEILQHAQVDIIHSMKLNSMKWFSAACGFMQTELLMQLLE